MRVRVLTPEQRQRARELHARRVPVKVIAREFGVSPRGIEWHLYPRIRERERERRASCR